MKRCPQCSFIYLDADEFCDLDGTPLSYADDRELEGNAGDGKSFTITRAPSKTNRMMVISTAALGLLLGVILFSVSYQTGRTLFQTASIPRIEEQARPRADNGPVFSPTPLVLESPSPSPKPTATTRTASTQPEPNRAVMSRSPVSTTTVRDPGAGRAIIRLTDGARIEADEVWRTRDGFWYRNKGIVTLIKSDRVKHIDRVSAKP